VFYLLFPLWWLSKQLPQSHKLTFRYLIYSINDWLNILVVRSSYKPCATISCSFSIAYDRCILGYLGLSSRLSVHITLHILHAYISTSPSSSRKVSSKIPSTVAIIIWAYIIHRHHQVSSSPSTTLSTHIFSTSLLSTLLTTHITYLQSLQLLTSSYHIPAVPPFLYCSWTHIESCFAPVVEAKCPQTLADYYRTKPVQPQEQLEVSPSKVEHRQHLDTK